MRKPSAKFLAALVPTVIFFVLFSGVLLLISTTQPAYLMPGGEHVAVPMVSKNNEDGASVPISIFVCPKPNSTDIPLNTAIEVFQPRPVRVENFSLTPKEPFSRVDKPEALYSQTTIFYPVNPLSISTTYNVSMLVNGQPFSWTFTTTSQTLNYDISRFLATYSLWIALAIAVAGSSISFLIFRQRIDNQA